MDEEDWDEDNWDDELVPDAGNLGTSLQGLTYDFEKAIADVVDNSISHGDADNIWIIISNGEDDEDVDSPFVAIVDDGKGMSLDELRAALRYGAESDPSDLNLGRFGLGMKTASTSQCHVLTGCSRDQVEGEFNARSWDLNFLRSGKTKGKWIPLKRDPQTTIPKRCFEYLGESTGTIIHWEDLSKMIPNIATLHAHQIQSALGSRIKKTKQHLGMVFHRFIEGTTIHFNAKKVNIWVNDTLVAPLDPFAVWHQASRPHNLDEQDLQLEYEIEDSEPGRISLTHFNRVMSIRARILPRRDEFFAQEINGLELTANQVHSLVGYGKWNDSQGLYFYRLDRIIQAGRWSSLLSPDEKCKLARVSIDVGRDWDEILELNVTKTFIRLPGALTGTKQNTRDLRKIFANVRSRARNVYHDEGTEPEDKPIPPPGGFPTSIPKPVDPSIPELPKPKTTKVPVKPPLPLPTIEDDITLTEVIRKEIMAKMLASCESPLETETLSKIFERMGE